MLQNSRNLLFDDGYKLKLENPEMSLDNWMSYIDQKRCSFRVEKKVLKKSMTGTTYGYLISTNDPLWAACEPATRSRKDFQILQTQLEKRFPNAVVPKLARSEVDNLHLTEVFLTELSLNPFFRMDVSFSDFLNGKNTKYSQTKKNDKKHSQGTLRWLQQLTEYPDYNFNEETIKSIQQDLQQLKRATESLKGGLTQQIKCMTEMQNTAGVMAGSLSEYLAVEQTSEGKVNGSVSGLPPGRVQSMVTKSISLHEDYQAGLRQSYDGGSLERLTINTLVIIQKEIVAFTRLLGRVEKSKRECDSALAAYNALPNEAVNKESARENSAQKEIIFFKHKRALGFEIEKFRTYKTIRMQSVFDNLAKFHLRGAKRITEEWLKSGLQLNPQEEQYFLQQDQIYASQEANPVGRNRSKSVAMKQKSQRMTTQKSLTVIKSYKKYKAGELLTGFKTEKGYWQVTNSKRQKGIIKDDCVRVNEGGAPTSGSQNFGAHYQKQTGYNSAPSAPVAPQAPSNPLAMQPTFNNPAVDEDEEDWSMSEGEDEGGNDNFGQVGGTPPSAGPRMGMGAPKPPGLGSNAPVGAPPPNTAFNANPPPMAPMSKPVGQNPVPPQTKPAGVGMGMGGPTPPNVGPPAGLGQQNQFARAPQPAGPSGFGQPKPPSAGPGGFGQPKPPSSGPGGFGQPKPPSAGPGGFGQPKPPSAGPSGFGQPKPPSSGPKPPTGGPGGKKKFGGGGPKKKLGGGMPAGPGGGKPAFLAAIGGNNMKALKKVPDSEKSKEIGGDMGLSATDRGAGKKSKPMGGGGGLMGEMAAAFARRGN